MASNLVRSKASRASKRAKRDPEAIALGKQIRKSRKQQKLTQEVLAYKAQRVRGGETLYRGLICAIESGKRMPTIPQLKAIACILGVDVLGWL